MARNEEKHSGRLNRLWLQQLDEEHAKKNPPRPGLGSLHTAQDVKKWMPSIKKDIDFYLKQSQVGCYPDRKIAEFSEKIEGLTKEYKAYLRKYRELENDRSSTPWADEPYSRKHKTTKESDGANDVDLEPAKKLGKSSDLPTSSKKTSFVPLSLPLLDVEDSYKDIYGYSIVNPQLPTVSDSDIVSHDLPLEFNWNKNMKALEYHGQGDSSNTCQEKPVSNEWTKNVASDDGNYSANAADSLCDCAKNLFSASNCDSGVNDNAFENQTLNSSNFEQLHRTDIHRCTCKKVVNTKDHANMYSYDKVSVEKSTNVDNGARNILNLPYSDSSSDEDT